VPRPIDHDRTQRRARLAPIFVLLALMSCAALSACGGSSHATSASNSATSVQTSASAAVSTSSAGAAVRSAASASATAHAGGTPAGSTAGGSTGTSAKSQANSSGSSNGSSQSSSKYPVAFVTALRTFTTCVRSHGLNIPEPNLSGHGEIFSRDSVNPNNPNYRSALQACEADLINILRAAGAAHIKGLG